MAERLDTLLDQIHSGRYRAKASKRIWIPKSDGRKRPIGIAALEDKIVQQALVEVLQVIYEEDFLGFTHMCSKCRKKGKFKLLLKTMSKRLRSKINEVCQILHRHRHKPIVEQGKWLRSVVQGYFNYHAVPGNRKAMDSFRTQTGHGWLRALRRRSQKGRSLTWEHMQRQMMKWIPTARVLHPYPNQRLCV